MSRQTERSRTVAVVAIGDELTEGRIDNTNASWLSRRLRLLGLDTTIHLSVPDDPALMRRFLSASGADTPSTYAEVQGAAPRIAATRAEADRMLRRMRTRPDFAGYLRDSMDWAHLAAQLLDGVILSAEDREIGLIVDKLIGEEDIVIKSLEEYLSNTRGISGASIMGDGTIALILDVVELVSLAIAKEKEIRGKQAEDRYKRRKKVPESRDDIPPQ